MKTSNYPPNTNNILKNYYIDLDGNKIPFIEVNPQNSKLDFETILFHGYLKSHKFQ